jgi:hypothetical protein
MLGVEIAAAFPMTFDSYAKFIGIIGSNCRVSGSNGLERPSASHVCVVLLFIPQG